MQIDAVARYIGKLKRYVINAVDAVSRMAFSYGYTSLSSAAAKDFMSKCQQAFPFAIRQIQTDNGSEFAKHFATYLEHEKTTHSHTYPKHPQSNAYVESYNGTMQAQFVNLHEEELASDLPTFNEKLLDYVFWYNTDLIL